MYAEGEVPKDEVDIPSGKEDCPDEPSTEGTHGHCGIIVVINHGANLRVWGVLGEYR